MKKLRCYYCRAVLPFGRQFFCNSDCRQKYHANGQKPAAATVRPLPANLCWGCRRPLAGKQRRWCSERCRARAIRERKRAYGLQGDKSANMGVGYDWPEVQKAGWFTVQVEFEQFTFGLDAYSPASHVLGDAYLREYERLLRERMCEVAYGYAAHVRIIKRWFA